MQFFYPTGMVRSMGIDYVAAARAIVRRRKRALQLRGQGKTLEEIGKALGVSTERARQIVKKAEQDRAAE